MGYGDRRFVARKLSRAAYDNDLLYARGMRAIDNRLEVGGELRSLDMGVTVDQTQ
jgi:hypothetical protein